MIVIPILSFLFVFLAYLAWTKLHTLPNKSLTFALLYVIAFLVAPMSHLWHIIYSEDRITCDTVNKNNVFGWSDCFEFTWNNVVNTYELTIPIENIVLSAIAFYTLNELFYLKEHPRAIVAYILLAVQLLLGIILFFSPPIWLDNNYTRIYDISSFVLTTTALLVVEYLIEIKEYKNYNQIFLEI